MPEDINSTESVALEALAPTLQKLELGHKEAVTEAINSITGIALLAKNRKTSARAVELLGNYASLPRTKEAEAWEIYDAQSLAASKICGVALVLSDPDVDNTAIEALEKRLGVPVLDEKPHQQALLDLAIVASHSGAAQKEKTLKILTEYTQREEIVKGGWTGQKIFKETRATATQLMGIIGVS